MRYILSVLVVFALAACSDDSSPPPGSDAKADTALTDTSTGQDGTTDTGVTPDQSLADQATASDSSKTPKILASTHTGWQEKDCFKSGCHTKPVTGHTVTNQAECAKCHGGNGACKPNGANSGKKNHSETNCQSANCHGSKHGYSTKTDCISCHFASKGTIDC